MRARNIYERLDDVEHLMSQRRSAVMPTLARGRRRVREQSIRIVQTAQSWNQTSDGYVTFSTAPTAAKGHFVFFFLSSADGSSTPPRGSRNPSLSGWRMTQFDYLQYSVDPSYSVFIGMPVTYTGRPTASAQISWPQRANFGYENTLAVELYLPGLLGKLVALGSKQTSTSSSSFALNPTQYPRELGMLEIIAISKDAGGNAIGTVTGRHWHDLTPHTLGNQTFSIIDGKRKVLPATQGETSGQSKVWRSCTWR